MMCYRATQTYIQVLVESLPSIITMLLTGGDLDLGPFGDVADEW